VTAHIAEKSSERPLIALGRKLTPVLSDAGARR